MCLLMFNDKQRFWKIFSGEEMPTWVSCGGQSRGCELGSYCFLFPRIGSRQCTHEQTLAPFLLQKVTGARSGATRLEMSIKNVRVFSVAAGCQLQSCCDFGRVPRLRCVPGVTLCAPFADSDQCTSATASTAINLSPGVVQPSHELVPIYDLEGEKIPSVWQSRDENRTHCQERGSEMTCISGDCLETSHFVELLQHVVLWTNSF